MKFTAHERVYWGDSDSKPSPVGLRQFKAIENGEDVPQPHPDCIRLQSGKSGFNFARTSLRDAWASGNDEWPGTAYLEATTPPDALRLLLDWHPYWGKNPTDCA